MIVLAGQAEVTEIAGLALELWPEHTLEALTEEFEALLADPDCAVFLLVQDG